MQGSDSNRTLTVTENTIENTKKSLFDTWIQDDHLLVHLDARKEEVKVPVHLKDQHSLTLKLSMLFQGETKTDDNQVTTYLKFNGEYAECILPWTSIWGITSDQGVQKIWEHDLPKEVLQQAARAMLNSMGDKLLSPFKKKKDSIKSAERAEREKDISHSESKLKTQPNTPLTSNLSDNNLEKRRSMLKRIK